MSDSVVASASYTITAANQVAAPTFAPPGGTYTAAQSVSLASGTSGASIRFTTDGSAPTATTGTLYASAIPVSATTTINAIAYKSGMTDSAVLSAHYTINDCTIKPLQPYATNPNCGYGAYVSTPITIDGANTGSEWTDDKLIAIEMANDDARSLSTEWLYYEYPVVDFTHLWAAWDDDNRYIAFQVADLTDVVSSGNFAAGKSWNSTDGAGILGCVALDTVPDKGAKNLSWGILSNFAGADLPDYELLFHGNLSQDKASGKAQSDGNFSYGPPAAPCSADLFCKDFTALGADIKVAEHLVPTNLWGVMDVDDRADAAKLLDFLASAEHRHTRLDNDEFYELKIPLAIIGVTRTYLETTGIGIFIVTGGRMDTIPHDEATLDTPGQGAQGIFEDGDADALTASFARIGHAK